jgi:hypothetical protein
MVQAAQPTLMKRVASFLLASGPPPPTRSWLSHSHLYSSPKRFPVESHLLLGCSHEIPKGASSTFDLSWCSTTAFAHKACKDMYCPMLHPDSSLGAGA